MFCGWMLVKLVKQTNSSVQDLDISSTTVLTGCINKQWQNKTIYTVMHQTICRKYSNTDTETYFEKKTQGLKDTSSKIGMTTKLFSLGKASHKCIQLLAALPWRKNRQEVGFHVKIYIQKNIFQFVSQGQN